MLIKTFTYCNKKKINEIKKLISKHWITKTKKKHILVRNKKVFDWLYLFKKDRYSFFFTQNEKKKCNGFLGFIRNSKFSKKLKKNDVFWLSMWLGDIKLSNNKNLTGLKIIFYFLNYFKKKTIATIGCNDKTRDLYERLGFKVGSLSHAYLLNPNILNFKIAKLDKKSKHNQISQNNEDRNYEIVNSIKNLKDSKFDRKYSKIFNKNIEYFVNKYEKNDFYFYEFLILKEREEINFLIIYRKILVKKKLIIRIIDFYGNYKNLPKLKNSIINFFKNINLEYIDFYYYGIPDKYLIKMGFNLKINNPNIIIPNYFEPFIRENITINYAVKNGSKRRKFFFFKGDCDQERPNIL